MGCWLVWGRKLPPAEDLLKWFGKVSEQDRLAVVAALARLPVDRAVELLLIAARDRVPMAVIQWPRRRPGCRW